MSQTPGMSQATTMRRGSCLPAALPSWALRRCCALWYVGGRSLRRATCAAARAAGEAIHVVTGPSDGCHPLMLPSATISALLAVSAFVNAMRPKLGELDHCDALVSTSREVSDSPAFPHSAHSVGRAIETLLPRTAAPQKPAAARSHRLRLVIASRDAAP